MFHYTLDHRLDREGFLSDALVELDAEPGATTSLSIIVLDRPELAHEEVRIVHKLLVTRPHRSLALFASFYWPLLLGLEEVDLLHRGEVDEVCWSDHDPGELLLLTTLKPLVVFPLDGDRLVVLVEMPLGFIFILGVEVTIMEPPKSFESKIIWLVGFIF